MTLVATVPFVAAALAAVLALTSVVRKAPSFATWAFAAGMLLLALDSTATGLALGGPTVAHLLAWLAVGFLVKMALPAVWLAFSATYARANPWESLRAQWLPLALLALVPLAIVVAAPTSLLALVPPAETGGLVMLRSVGPARIYHATLLVGFVLVLMNLEQSFRASVGTMRWRIKYVVLGLGVVFGAYIFVRTQAILYPVYDPVLAGIESSALLIGGIFLGIAYGRDALGSFDVYPSRAVLRSSVTVLIVGGYLFLVGVLAQAVRRFGGAESFQLQALIVLAGVAGLAMLLLSDRLRQRIQAFIGRHFRKAQHDSTRLWTDLSRRLSAVRGERELCESAATSIATSFEVLAVSVWRTEQNGEALTLVASTASSTTPHDEGTSPRTAIPTLLADLAGRAEPFDLETDSSSTGAVLRRLAPSAFPNGGHRWVVPLRSGDEVHGVIVLADRVNGVAWSTEERELLQCMADQVAAALQNLRLGEEVARGRELDAFRTMSAFFVHDLKNATNSLNLMLRNLPVHFDDPAFRADALRGIGNTVSRIDGMIARLSALREAPGLRVAPVDVKALVEDAQQDLAGAAVTLTSTIPADLPHVAGDRDQLRSVLANLLLNARDALTTDGAIQVRAGIRGPRVVIEVEDNGRGMSQAFLRDGLFRPFQSTKSKGLGIGMFQARQVVDAHGGSIQVESQEGVGTTVRVSLPIATEDLVA